MTNFSKYVDYIAEDLRSEFDQYRRNGWEMASWSEMLDAFGIESSDLKDDIHYTVARAVNDGELPDCYFDDMSIEDSDGSIKTYRQLTNAVRKVLFAA